MTYPQVWFVDAPSEDSSVRLDLNSDFGLASLRVEHDGFSLGAPPLLGEPDSVSAALGLREPSWNQQIRGPKAAAHEVRTALSRELLRPTNWVRVRLDETSPVWYLETYRGAFAALDLQYVKKDSGEDVWRLPVALVAEPYLLGERVTIAQTTLGNALNATNPMRVALPALEGDAQTGLRVKVTPQGASGQAESWILAVVSANSGTITDPTYDIGVGDIWTAGSIASAGVSNAAYLGGSYRTLTFPTGTSGSFIAFSATLPASPPPGRYKVLMHCELDPVGGGVGKKFYFQFAQALNGAAGTAAAAENPIVATDTPVVLGTAYTFQGWIDLGETTFPFAGSVVPADVTAGGAPPVVYVNQYRPTNTGVNDVSRVDAIKLIPIDGPTVKSCTLLRSTTELLLFGKIGTFFDATMNLTWDADSDSIYKTLISSGLLIPYPGIAGGGAYPVADPAATQNMLFCFPVTRGATSSSTAATAAAGTWLVDVSYHPRKLHI